MPPWYCIMAMGFIPPIIEALGNLLLLVLPVEELDSAVEVSLGLGEEPSAAAGDLVSSLFS